MVTTAAIRFPHFGQRVIWSMRPSRIFTYNSELAFLFQSSVSHGHIFASLGFRLHCTVLTWGPANDGLQGRLRRIDMTVLTERAVLAGGCFWGVQDLLRRYPGVISTRVGYTGGEVPNATYRNHGNHAEAIEITFDPQIISYRKLLEFFFQIHDPSTLNRQGNDRGASYRSAIFYANDEQKRIAEDTIADVDASGLWPGKVVTEVAPVGPFWEAEPEHQDYLEKYPDGYTCHFIRPEWTLPHRQEAGRKMAG